MRIPDNLGMILLAIWLILMGLTQLFSASGIAVLLGILALAAGILLLINHLNLKTSRRR